MLCKYIVEAACVLHNFILLENSAADAYNIDDINNAITDENVMEGPEEEEGIVENKRANLANMCIRY